MHVQIPIDHSSFKLDTAGVAGFFGGDETLSAMATVHLYRGRRWFGWYNSPGSYIVAKKYGQLASSRFWDGLFPGPNARPAEVFGLDGKRGPRYVASLSGTDMVTGHLAYLLTQRSKELPGVKVEGTMTLPAAVTIIRVGDVTNKDQVGRMSTNHALLATIPISISLMTCIACASLNDWLAFGLILFGVITSGITCFVVGTARIHLQSQTNVTKGVPPGDGLLLTPRDVIVLKGAEKDVNAITKGKFILGIRGAPEYRAIGLCSVLLVTQFMLHLLLIPQATLFGQVMFLSSLAASWIYNLFLSSLENEKIQGDLLCKVLRVDENSMKKYDMPSRRSQAVFACLILSDGVETNEDFDAERMLSLFISNKTRAWSRWRAKVARELRSVDPNRSFQATEVDREGLSEHECKLLDSYLEGAQHAYNVFQQRSAQLRSGTWNIENV